VGAYEIMEHTADVGVIAIGETLADALSWLACGMFSIVADLDTVEPRESVEFSVQSSDIDSLAVDWLNELLYRYEAEFFLPNRFDLSVDEAGTCLTARCTGERFDTERHSMATSVKAATYHGLEVSRDDGWRIQVILDV
jgi:SHS2 domain-containing protein